MSGQKEIVGRRPVVGSPAPETSLGPGFRFHPSDEELLCYYLRRKACGKPVRFQPVTELDVYKHEPWELADKSMIETRDLEWYFFSPVDKRQQGSRSRTNRSTGQGFWKVTGNDRPVKHQTRTIGMKKTLVFHTGRAPGGQRTNWIMHEYRLCDSELESAGVIQDAVVLCRVFEKHALGPPNGENYGPFIVEDWNDKIARLITGGNTDDVGNGDEPRPGCLNLDEDTPLTIGLPRVQSAIASRNLVRTCKRATPQSKRSKSDDTNPCPPNGSEGSTTLQHPPLEHGEVRENDDIPAWYSKFISNLESEVLNVFKEHETLKIEVMKERAMMNLLQSRINALAMESADLISRH